MRPAGDGGERMCVGEGSVERFGLCGAVPLGGERAGHGALSGGKHGEARNLCGRQLLPGRCGGEARPDVAGRAAAAAEGKTTATVSTEDTTGNSVPAPAASDSGNGAAEEEKAVTFEG